MKQIFHEQERPDEYFSFVCVSLQSSEKNYRFYAPIKWRGPFFYLFSPTFLTLWVEIRESLSNVSLGWNQEGFRLCEESSSILKF